MNKLFQSIGYITVGILLLVNLAFSAYLIFYAGGVINTIGCVSVIATSIILIALYDCIANMSKKNISDYYCDDLNTTKVIIDQLGKK